MKNVILRILFGLLVCLGGAEARFFMGVEGGYTFGHLSGNETHLSNFNLTFSPPSTIANVLKNGARGYSAGIVLGTEDINGAFGTRWYLGGGYTQIKDIARYIDATTGIDLILNFYYSQTSSFGLFAGLSMDYHYWLNTEDIAILSLIESKHLLDFSGKVGITSLFDTHHRVELYAKLPIASMSIFSSDKIVLGGVYSPKNVTFGASYKFVF